MDEQEALVFEQQVFEYLDDLRESGETNMYGAASYVEDEFWIDADEAKRLLVKWMQTFSERHPS